MIVLALLSAAGCSSWIEDRAATTTLKILERGNTSVRRIGDVQLAREALPGGIVQLGAFAAAYPGHRGFRELHADSLCQYAIGFIFDDWEAASFEKRADDATRLSARLEGLLASCIEANLALLPKRWAAAAADHGQWKALLPSAQKKDAPRLLWIASAEAVRVALDPMKAGIPRLDRAIATLTRCTTLAPGLRDSDGEVLLGTLLAGRARFFGGPDGEAQLATARRQLGASAIIVDVMTARGPAVARQDRKLFLASLDRALAADITQWPDRRLANELARVKALRYRAAVDQLIPAAPP